MRPLLLACTCVLVQAAYPPQDPASSLDALLHDIWTQGAKNGYNLYMGKARVPMSAAARDAFAPDILKLAAHDNVSGILLQKSKMEYSPKSHLPEPAAFEGAWFVHFLRPDFKGEAITERIYLNLHPDHAVEVMRFVVAEILARDHGVQEVKVSTPAGLETRADAALIYASSLADVDWALGRLADYQKDHRDHFLPDLPAATRPRLIGVSTAAQPTPALKSDSFGSYLSQVAANAMAQDPKPADFAEFRIRVRALMTVGGVDPDHPDRLNRRP